MTRNAPDFDAIAAVIDNHTGRVRARFQGLDAADDAASFARDCRAGGVQHLSSTSIITGDKARKAIRNGRV